MRLTNKLTAAGVSAMRIAGRYSDGNGLYLQVGPNGGKSWLFRFMLDGRARWQGLGPIDVFSLKDARERARSQRQLLAIGIDPLEAKQAAKREKRASAAKRVTFKEAYARYIAQNEASWKNDKHRAQWRSTLATYADPVIGDLDVAAIETPHIVAILEPIWATKTETASRLRGRIETVLAWAAFAGLRSGANPATWKGHLDAALPNPSRVKNAGNHAALPYADMPAFMERLASNASISSVALQFTILCAARTGEAINAQWSEFDLTAKLWVIPKGRMKAGKEHRVPLSDHAVELLQSLPRESDSDFVFIGAKAGKPLSNMAMLELVRGMMPDQKMTVHGFRSTFRDWAGEITMHKREVIEHALAHQLKDKAEASYQRGDLLNKRRVLMNDWSAYCLLSNGQENVIVMQSRK